MTFAETIRARRDLLVYVPAAITTTISAVTGRDRVHLTSKLLLAPTLGAGVLMTRSQRCPKRTGALLVALTGSGVGDALMYGASHSEQDDSHRYLRWGASAFAVQQICFLGLLHHDGNRPRVATSAMTGAVLALLATLDPTGGPPDPVLTGYGLLLGAMSATAMGEGGNPPARRRLALGGALFLLSDAAIILGERFATTPSRRAVTDGVIMATYAGALGLLVHGLREEPTVA